MKEKTVIIEFPLRGEWQAPTTPAKQIPSHGTNRLGLRYAFDFLQINWQDNKRPFHGISFIRYLLFGVPLKKYYCWGQEIFAPCDGEIVMVTDGIPERKIVHWLVDSAIAIKNSAAFNEARDKYSQIAGNYIVMKCSNDVYIAFAHLQTGSIKVSINEKVKKGSFLGKVGHSGNSTSPHLHFQLMDSDNFASAKGIQCLFEKYDVYQNNTWKTVYNQMPSDKDRIRFCKD
jgi:murein DD-endopeptidase MepM/ murein hydrolase activator NlpD